MTPPRPREQGLNTFNEHIQPIVQVYYLVGSITLGHYSVAHKGRVPQGLVFVDRVRAWFDEAHPGRSVHHNKGASATTSDWASACVDSIIDHVGVRRRGGGGGGV